MKHTDPLNRVTQFQWCTCGGIKSLTDAMGRTTTWRNDVQGRVTAKVYPDGSEVNYLFENTTSRVRQRTDEKFQVTQYSYNRDDTVNGISYAVSLLSTPDVFFTYDPNYRRQTSMSDGTGTTRYDYHSIGAPAFGAGLLASVDGPLPNDTVTFSTTHLAGAFLRR
jgi:YD repeat-containing protein